MSAGPRQPPGVEPEPPAAAPCVSGPSFPPALKAIATVLVLALVALGAGVLADAPAGSRPTLGGWLAIAAIAAVVASGYWGIVAGRTSCDGVRIEQTGPWRRSVEIADITRIALVRVRGLEGLVVPRLVVRTRRGLTTFHAADPAVLERFEALVRDGRPGPG